MANGVKTRAREIAKEVHFQKSDQLADLIRADVAAYAQSLSEAVFGVIESATRPVTWREAAVLVHHEVPKKDAQNFTMPEFEEYLNSYDHSECPTNHWDEKRRQIVKGCFVAQKAYEDSIS